jgi:hypothetical protein
MWSRTKNIIQFEHIEEYEKMLIKMKIIKQQLKFYFIIFHCWFSNSGSRVLTIEDAIKIALENNYDIKLKRPEG